MTEAWRAELKRWSARDLSGVDYVYIWVDGVHVNVRLLDATGAANRLCLLVIVGVRPDGTNELVAVTDGHREDTQLWLDLLCDLRDRGCARPSWRSGTARWGSGPRWRRFSPRRGPSAARHKTANCLAAFPKRLHNDAKTALTKISTAETRAVAVDATHEFASEFAAHPKAVARSGCRFAVHHR